MAKKIRRGIGRLACAALVAALAACGSVPVGPGFYRVERGDTVSKIARSNRQSVQNIVRWNNLSNPNSIEVGQVLRVAPPAGVASATPRAEARENAPSTARMAPVPETLGPPPSTVTISLVWPTTGQVIRGFDGRNSKGIDIANAAGTPIVAATSGTVVYAGNGLRGYGNLLI
ncbi:MAG TPA: LysM peptidoglycan-binding domain-containing protein, partial [Paraburkholderia sp.]